MIRVDDLQSFVAVAQTNSFTKAAKRLCIDKSKVSRDVRAVEVLLRVPLIVRSTKAVRLTPEGEELFRRLAPLLAEIEAAIHSIPDRASAPSGEVTITTTPDLGRDLMAPVLVRFRARFPAVRVRVILTNELMDLFRDGVDLALRVGRPDGDDYVAKKLAELEAGFYAAPAYLKRTGPIDRLEHLLDHEGLWPTPPKGQTSFATLGSSRPPAVACTDFLLLAEMARSGGGVALLPTFLAARDEVAGALVRVLPAVTLRQAPLYLVSHQTRAVAPRVAALRSFLLEAIPALVSA